METMRSTVKWFDAKKGYGFIDHPGGGDDVFVHYSQIESDADFKTLRTGQDVTFELKDGPKGLHAATVVLIEDDEASGERSPAASPRGEVSSQSTPAHATQTPEHRPSHTLSSPYAEAAEVAEAAEETEESPRHEARAQDAPGQGAPGEPPRMKDSAADEQRASFR